MEQLDHILGGDLETLGLQSTLKMLSLSEKTGILSVRSGQEHLLIALDRGAIVWLEEPDDYVPDVIEIFRLRQHLHKSFPRERLEQMQRMAGGDPMRALTILEQAHLISPTDVQRHIEFGVVQALCRAVRWERGQFEFHRGIASIQARMQHYQPLNMDHTLLEALRLADERDHTPERLSRKVLARWMPTFDGDVSRMSFMAEEVGVLSLCSGHLPIAGIAYGLLIPEHRVSAIVQKLLTLGVIELVDPLLEHELEASLSSLRPHSRQTASAPIAKDTPEQRLLMVVRTLGDCVTALLDHHARYARALRGRGELPRGEVVRYLQGRFEPVLRRLQRSYPRMEEIVRFEEGRIVYNDLEALPAVVRGQELADCYWDAARVFYQLAQEVFAIVLYDEAGHSRLARRFDELRATFLQEVDEELAWLSARYPPPRG